MAHKGKIPIVEIFGIQGLSLLPTWLLYFLARSNSHSVATRGGGTNIPLAAGEAQEDETILKFGCSSHAGFRFVCLDPPELVISWKIGGYCACLVNLLSSRLPQ